MSNLARFLRKDKGPVDYAAEYQAAQARLLAEFEAVSPPTQEELENPGPVPEKPAWAFESRWAGELWDSMAHDVQQALDVKARAEGRTDLPPPTEAEMALWTPYTRNVWDAAMHKQTALDREAAATQ